PVVVVPGRPRQVEQPLALHGGRLGVRHGVDEDVLVAAFDHRHKAATSRMCGDSSIPLPNTSPDMSPTPTAVKSSVWVSTPSSRKCRRTLSQAPFAVIPIRLWS